ncbi:MAG: flagellar motor stator protein MotA [Azospirillaceae bacterium]|nr:flagellar motor stator protein MotA [Azospirillaceae bacterium]
MLPIAGIVLLFACVFGSYIVGGGKIGILIEAAPLEAVTILGAAIAAYLISNGGDTLKRTLKEVPKIFSGPKWKPGDYKDLLCLLFLITKMMKTKGLIAIEPHIENPKDSSMFKRYPKILGDHFSVEFLCDNLRMMSMSLDDPHQLAEVMETQLEKHHHESLKVSHAIQTMADGIPALGIVAAVLGVIKTMARINEPPEVLGMLIGGALVGTFLGVFLAYGLVGPISSRLKEIADEEFQFYLMIKETVIAHLHGNAAQISVEIARGSIPSQHQPNFAQVEEALNNIPPEAA